MTRSGGRRPRLPGRRRGGGDSPRPANNPNRNVVRQGGNFSVNSTAIGAGGVVFTGNLTKGGVRSVIVTYRLEGEFQAIWESGSDAERGRVSDVKTQRFSVPNLTGIAQELYDAEFAGFQEYVQETIERRFGEQANYIEAAITSLVLTVTRIHVS